TDNLFTGQKQDESGLYYYNARYYDPEIGQFISPDTIVPEPMRVDAYNRYMYALGNPLKFNDPSGHCIDGISTIVCIIAAAALVGGTANAAGDYSVQVYENWDKERSISNNLADFNKAETGIAFGFGAASGALAPITGGMPAIVTNSTLGAMQEVTTDMVVEGKSLSQAVDPDTAVAGILGGIGTFIQKAIPTKLVNEGRWGSVFEWPTTPNISVSPEFAADNSRRLMGRQLQAIFSSRTFMGATIGNVPIPEDIVPEVTENSCGWRCPIQSLRELVDGE
ncbi:RHS repeat-associated core domain-containing protein, partial [Candidatus Kaiserbacteria bacterium]|nr:RHS repeat-associated core domain-containing protein [Candidatus Kaiserbacteria bacterium]